jgi:ComF family protein
MTLHPLLSDLLSVAAETLFPTECLGCHKPGAFICTSCLETLPRLSGQVCIACQKSSPLGWTHASCAAPDIPERLWSCFNYKHPLVAKLIITGKYKFVPDIFRVMGNYAASALMTGNMLAAREIDLISYIPLHPTRQRWRGFNQAEVTAYSIGLEASIQVTSTLIRTRHGQIQKNLSKTQRLANLEDIFAATQIKKISGRRILLVDDVATTGTTLLQASRALKLAGAASVWCATLAREL